MNHPIYMLTGLPSSGKTTLGTKLAEKLGGVLLDGDIIRTQNINDDFSKEGRINHIYEVAKIADEKSRTKPVIMALINPFKNVRDYLKLRYSNLIEVYLDCGLRECKKRDVKGMYAKAMNGEIKDFTGVDSKYEKPDNPDIIINTKDQDVDNCIFNILNNNKEKVVYSLFIGRFQYVHKGHIAIIQKVLDEGKNVLIALRDTIFSKDNPYTIYERKSMFRKHFTKEQVKIIVIPDIASINYGRGVGYEIREIHIDKELEDISATELRKQNG